KLRDFLAVGPRGVYFVDGGLQRIQALRRKGVATRQLVYISPRDDEIRRPHNLRLILDIQLFKVYLVGSVDFVLRDVLIRYELEHVHAARDFRAIDIAIVPISRPLSAHPALGGVQWSAIEVGDLHGMRRIGEVY